MKRHKHSLSNYRIFSCDMGELVPIGITEVLPGDTFQHRTSALIRLVPLNSPVMHPVKVRIHSWFVPNRIIWDGWEDFITGDNLIDAVPQLTVDASDNRLTDFMGIPPITGVAYNSLAVRAYNKIYNEFYRDQDLVTVVDEDDVLVKQIAWEKDYFSAARPWTQKGPAVTLPLGNRAPIIGLGAGTGESYPLSSQDVHESGGVDETYPDAASTTGGNTGLFFREDAANPGYPDMYADLSAAEAINVNDLREAFALQRYQEARARYGSRYTEYLRYLGVRSSDARLQRPEYLGGGKQTISFSEVLQTAPDDTTSTSVGELLGHGIGALRTKKYRRFFEEHGHVVTLLSVRPKVVYTNALDKKWTRQTKEDYYQKELEAVGQQAVPSQEIFAESPANETIFGYVDRYREYREERSQVATEMRELTNYWHMARDFASAPTLNQSFVDCVPTKRIHAVETNDVLQIMINHSIQARRMVNRHAQSEIR